ncbi:anthrone oxygenase family protein [Brachybacterium paraconglomeratum]|uniref:anthrone oxygenase family protein n=1 Tax=Brachybacterium paraconglomeratum TaxID=173362 RepID=UPI0037C73102
MIPALAVLATTSTGLLVGVELSVAVVVNPILRALPIGAMIDGRAHGARMLGRTMPPWYIGSTTLIAGFSIAAWGTLQAVLALAAAGLLLATVLLSVLVLVPINNRSSTWTAASHPTDWRVQQQRWDRLHGVRVVLLLAALSLVVIAAVAA